MLGLTQREFSIKAEKFSAGMTNGDKHWVMNLTEMWDSTWREQENQTSFYNLLPSEQTTTSFPPFSSSGISYTAYVISGVLLAVVGLLGSLGNGLLIWVFVR